MKRFSTANVRRPQARRATILFGAGTFIVRDLVFLAVAWLHRVLEKATPMRAMLRIFPQGPQGLKPADLAALIGTDKSVPFQNIAAI
jgi:hypothetical protein